MPENVFHVAQIAPQVSGTFAAPGASVAAITILPVTAPVGIELDRASRYPAEDYGKNVKNHAGRGYHGVRGSTLDLEGELTFEQAMHLFEMHYAGAVTPTGTNPYTWGYLLEHGSPTLLPYTVETGGESSTDQWEAAGVLIDELSLGFDDLDAPGAHPWTFRASCLGLTRAVAALTGSLSSTAVETMQGHLTILKQGSTGTAFASLSELALSLVAFNITSRRYLVRRNYGGTTDVATGYGFRQKTVAEVTAKVKISSTAKTDIHDAWNSSGTALGEKRWRLEVDGTGDNVADLDFRFGMFAVPVGERDGERVYEVTGETVEDSTLGGQAKWTIVNSIADLTP